MPSEYSKIILPGSSFAMVVLTIVVFLSAFLLFAMEPLVGRLLAPYFGGAVHVWLTSMMLFQAMLFLGYLYSHLLAKKLGPWHLLLLALPLFNLPLRITAEPGPEMPILTLFVVMLTRVALPFTVLSTTAIVAQSWLSRSALGQKCNPYPLYAASNAGSLFALLSYPFLVEPLVGLRVQGFALALGYLAYILLMVISWFTLRPAGSPAPAAMLDHSEFERSQQPQPRDYFLWLMLSCLPSAFLLAVTNVIALEVGSFPLVWVIPLAIYLGSFVVTFRNNGGVPTLLSISWPTAVILGFIFYSVPLLGLDLLRIVGYLFVLLSICIVAHGTLYERRPQTRYLTNFYLAMALGGWLGGIAVSIVAPLVFTGMFEYPVILSAILLAFLWSRRASFVEFWGRLSQTLKVGWVTTLAIILGVFGFFIISPIVTSNTNCRFSHRNFYGVMRVVDNPPTTGAPSGYRILYQGKTIHGAQILGENHQDMPISYYYRGGPISEAYSFVQSPRNIAVVGLGAGAESSYTHINDSLTFYEIDPDNEKIARTWFSYLNNSKAPIRVITGDGRLSLQAEKAHRLYDIIEIDAFTGDGIPTNLLTREAMEIYLKRLSQDGIILFHISNRYYDLRPVVKSTGRLLQLKGAFNLPAHKKLSWYQLPAQCVVLARNLARIQPFLDSGWVKFGEEDGLKEILPWTDDYINILAPLSSRMLNRLRHTPP